MGGEAPYSVFPKLNQDDFLSAVRHDRYQDRNLFAGSFEFKRKLTGALSLFSFLSSGTVAFAWSRIFHEEWKWGGGLGLHYQFSRLTRPLFRAEAGWFGGEFTLRVAVGKGL